MKERYDQLLSKIIERKSNVDKFIKVLHTQTTWLTNPASTKYHLNKEGGLLEHSIGVAETLLQLRAALAPEISEESCVIVGLFHDIGKVGMPGKPYYLPETKNGKPTGTYTINPEIVAMSLSLRSLYLVSQYIPLSDTEAQAIAYHDGMYVPEGRSVAHKEEPLLLLLHWADMWTASVKEREKHNISSANPQSFCNSFWRVYSMWIFRKKIYYFLILIFNSSINCRTPSLLSPGQYISNYQ